MDAAYIDIPGRGLGTMHLNSDLNSRDAPILRSGRVGSAFSNKFLLLHTYIILKLLRQEE